MKQHKKMPRWSRDALRAAGKPLPLRRKARLARKILNKGDYETPTAKRKKRKNFDGSTSQGGNN